MACVLALAACALEQNEATPSLVLERLFAEAIPDTFAVSGVGATPEGQVFAWSAERSTGLFQSDDGWVPFDLGTSDSVGLTVEGTPPDLRFTVLDGPSRRLIEMDGGEIRTDRAVVLEGEQGFLFGIATPEAWFVTRRVEGHVELVRIPSDRHADGPPTPVFRLEPPSSTEVQVHPWNGTDVLVTEVRDPFRTFGLGSAGDRVAPGAAQVGECFQCNHELINPCEGAFDG